MMSIVRRSDDRDASEKKQRSESAFVSERNRTYDRVDLA